MTTVRIWACDFTVYAEFEDGVFALDLRDYSHANAPKVKELIDNPAMLGRVAMSGPDAAWPNGFCLDADVIREEGQPE